MLPGGTQVGREIEFVVREATSEDGKGWYWHLTLTKNDCLIGPFASEEEATKDALETITGRAVITAVDVSGLSRTGSPGGAAWLLAS
jgi:hypothetical protein